MPEKNKFALRTHSDLLYWPVSSLTGYLADGHELLREESISIRALFDSVTGKNPEVHEQLNGICDRFSDIFAHINEKATADEDLYFPFIEALAEAHDEGSHVDEPAFGSVNRIMLFEAEAFGLILESLHDLIRETAMVEVAAGDIDSLANLTQRLRNFGDTCRHLGIVKFKVLFQRAAELENHIERRSKGVA